MLYELFDFKSERERFASLKDCSSRAGTSQSDRRFENWRNPAIWVHTAHALNFNPDHSVGADHEPRSALPLGDAVATRRCGCLAVTAQALFHDPDLLLDALAPPTAGLDDLQPTGKATVSFHIHRDSALRADLQRQGAVTGRLQPHHRSNVDWYAQFCDLYFQ